LGFTFWAFALSNVRYAVGLEILCVVLVAATCRLRTAAVAILTALIVLGFWDGALAQKESPARVDWSSDVLSGSGVPNIQGGLLLVPGQNPYGFVEQRILEISPSSNAYWPAIPLSEWGRCASVLESQLKLSQGKAWVLDDNKGTEAAKSSGTLSAALGSCRHVARLLRFGGSYTSARL
jgi:hypothetical protein